MAIGQAYSDGNESSYGNGNQNTRGNTGGLYYCPLKVNEAGGKKGLQYEFSGGLLKLKLNAKDINGQWKRDPDIFASLSPTKATLLANEIVKFKKYLEEEKKIDENKAFGVPCGMGEKITFVAFHATKDKRVILTIGKFDGNGEIIERVDFPLNYEYHYSLNWSDLDSMTVEKIYDNYLELDQLLHLVYDFGRNMNGAAAYASAYIQRYDYSRIMTRFEGIYDKLGIEIPRRNTNFNSENGGTNNFLQNTNGRSEKVSIDEMFATD